MGRTKSKSWQPPAKGGAGGAGGALQKRGGGRAGGAKATVADDYAASDSDSDRDMDAMMKKTGGKLSLNAADDVEDRSEDEEEEIMGLSDDDDDEEEDDEDEADGDDDDDDDDDEEDEDAMLERAMAKGGRMGELAKQAKAIGERLKLQRREDEDDEEGGDGDEDRDGDQGWGANKRKYYDADTAGLEGSDDEEALKEEEEEVGRLEKERAKRMSARDFGIDEEDDDEEDHDEDEDDDEGEKTLGALVKGRRGGGALHTGKGKKGGVEVEAVPKLLSENLTQEQREAALMADAPELLALLQDLKDSLHEVRHRVGPLLQEIKAGGLGTAAGVSYLEAKHLLLLQYCTHVVFYILLKAEGRSVKDHPVITRLLELRTYLEKIRPIDKRMQYQVDRLVRAVQVASRQEKQLAAQGGGKKGGAKAAAGGEGAGGAEEDEEDEEDALRYGPRRELMAGGGGTKGVAKGGEPAGGRGGLAAAAGGGGGVYKPPKIAPVSMEKDADVRSLTSDESRLLKEAQRKASRSTLVRELAEEIAGAPRELRHEVPGFDNLAAAKQRQRQEARAAVEEDMMVRVPLSKDEAKKMKQQRREGMSASAAFQDDFADEVADIVGMAQRGEGGGQGSRGSKLAELFGRQKVSQKFGAEPPRPAVHGGDEDVPRREALHDRRVKYDSAAARRAAAAAHLEGDGYGDEDDEFFGGGGGKRQGGKQQRSGGEEDGLYLEAKEAAEGRKKARMEKFPSAATTTLPPLPEEKATGARGITNEIERNRGLTPHRRKDLKNPRKKHRIKFAEANIRRKGAVQDMRSPTAGGYGGEATGVKSRVVKSRKLG